MGIRDFGRRLLGRRRRVVESPSTLALSGELLDLPLRREAATERAASRQEAMIAPGGILIDQDEDQFRRTSGGSRFKSRDLTPIQQDRMLEIAWYLIESNPFAKRLLQLMTDLVVGEGITASSKDQKIDEIIQKTWKHPINRLDQKLRELYFAFSLNGELIIPAARNPITGIPHLGYWDPMQIARVETRPDNVTVQDYLVLKPAAGETEGPRLKIINEDPISGLLEGDVFYFRTNALPNSGRGRSDLLTLADWLDLYDSLMFAEVERVKLLSAFVWDLKMEKSNETEIKKRLKELGTPTGGTVYGHNEKETLQAITPRLDAGDRSEVARTLAIHIAGAAGFPISWLGFPDSNKATIEGQNDVMLKTPSARQKEFAGHLATILRYAVEGATTKNRALYRDVGSAGFDIHVPEIAAKDIARVGAVIANVVSAMDTAQQNGTMSRRAAVVVQLAVLKHLGVAMDVEEVLAEADVDQEERQARDDERAALVAKATAAQAATTDPPKPGAPEPPAPPKKKTKDNQAREAVAELRGRLDAIEERPAPAAPAPAPNVNVSPVVVNATGGRRRVELQRDPTTQLVTGAVLLDETPEGAE
jgi:hypothetical protein